MHIGFFVDAYITGDFCIGNDEKVNADELELAPLVEYLFNLKIFMIDEDTPMSISTLKKLAYNEWQQHKEVRHYQKHKKKPDFREK